ncbi:hypothetical protein D1007_17141 [Hordeum vulgare]|nr:hypothetical protein D1007_17141 [Hordeum vulgare]
MNRRQRSYDAGEYGGVGCGGDDAVGATGAGATGQAQSFFLDAFEVPEPPTTLFLFADVLSFFGRAAFGRFEGFITAGAGTGATVPAAKVIRGDMKRPRARLMIEGAPMEAEARQTLPALGFATVAVGSRL